MFIDRESTNIPAAFGGAECCWMSTRQLEFRPSERRAGGVGSPEL